MEKLLDIEYDFRTDSNGGDVDECSPTLRKYHKILWSKPLPNGMHFKLSEAIDEYLFFETNSIKIRLSSDWMINTYLHWDKNSLINEIRGQINKDDLNNYNKITHTIGNYIIFPKHNPPSRKDTINTKRGKDNKISDRFDLTLECIRRYYLNEVNDNPLYEVLNEFDYYFKLFNDFKGFCDFYFLQDLTIDYLKINYFLKHDSFVPDPYPKTIEEYNEYMKNTKEFIIKRNNRINKYVKNLL